MSDEERAELLANVQKSFELFYSLVAQYGLGVILSSENLTSAEYCDQIVAEFPELNDQYNQSVTMYGYDYDRAALDLVQSLKMSADSAIHEGNTERAEQCITPVCKLIYN